MTYKVNEFSQVTFEMTPEKFVDTKIDLLQFKKSIDDAIVDALYYDNVEYGIYEMYVCDLVSGSYGVYQFKAMAELFCAEFDPLSEEDVYFVEKVIWVIEDLEWYANEVCSVISKRLKLPGTLTCGYHEADQSFGVFYYLDEEEIAAIKEEMEWA